MTFERPWLLVLLLAPLALWILRRRRMRAEVRVASVLPFRGAAAGEPPPAPRRRTDAALLLAIAAAALLALAAAGLRSGPADRDLVLVIHDDSPLMDARLAQTERGWYSVHDEATRNAHGALQAHAPQAHTEEIVAGGDLQTAAVEQVRARGLDGALVVTRKALAPPLVAVGPSRHPLPNVGILDAVLDDGAMVVTLRSTHPEPVLATVKSGAASAPATIPPRGTAEVRLPAPEGRVTVEVSPGGSLPWDDAIVVQRTRGALRVKLADAERAPRIASVLRAAGMTIDAAAGDVEVTWHGGLAAPGDQPAVHFVPAWLPQDAERVTGDAAVIRGSDVNGADASSAPLPQPGVRISAPMRFSRGTAWLRDRHGALVAADPRVVYVGMDPEDTATDWGRDPSFAALLLAAIEHVAGGPDRLVVEGVRLAPDAYDEGEILPPPTPEQIRALVQRGGASGADLAGPLAVAGALLAAAAAWFGRR